MSSTHIDLMFKLLDIMAMGINLAPELMNRYQQSRDKVEQFIREGRDPTPEEWHELNSQLKALQDELSH